MAQDASGFLILGSVTGTCDMHGRSNSSLAVHIASPSGGAHEHTCDCVSLRARELREHERMVPSSVDRLVVEVFAREGLEVI